MDEAARKAHMIRDGSLLSNFLGKCGVTGADFADFLAAQKADPDPAMVEKLKAIKAKFA